MTEEEALKLIRRAGSMAMLVGELEYRADRQGGDWYRAEGARAEMEKLDEQVEKLIRELYEDRFILEGLRK